MPSPFLYGSQRICFDRKQRPDVFKNCRLPAGSDNLIQGVVKYILDHIVNHLVDFFGRQFKG